MTRSGKAGCDSLGFYGPSQRLFSTSLGLAITLGCILCLGSQAVLCCSLVLRLNFPTSSTGSGISTDFLIRAFPLLLVDGNERKKEENRLLKQLVPPSVTPNPANHTRPLQLFPLEKS